VKRSDAGRLLVRVERALSFVGLLCSGVVLVASLVLVTAGVIGRYVFGVAVVLVDEYVGYGLVIMAFMALADTLTAEKHIKIDSLIRLLPEPIQNWLVVATATIGLAVAIFVSVLTWQRAIISYHIGVVSVSPLETPLFIPQLFIPIGFTLFDIALLSYLFRKIEHALTARAKESWT
jgi:TRAP-type transport system small permease protein